MKLRSPFFVFLILTSLGLIFANTWQGFRFQELEREVRRLEAEQTSWMEKNKKVIAALAVLSSPQRVKALAVDKLGLKPIRPEDVLQIELGDGGVD